MLRKIAAILFLFIVPLSLVGQSARDKTNMEKSNMANKSKTPNEPDFNGLSQIAQIAISVGDLERATSFYRDKLLMKYLFTSNGMAFFDCGGIRLMLAGLESKRSEAIKFVVYFKVEDIQQGYKQLVERGVKFDEKPELAAKLEKFDLWLACFRDSENNRLCLMSEAPRRE